MRPVGVGDEDMECVLAVENGPALGVDLTAYTEELGNLSSR